MNNLQGKKRKRNNKPKYEKSKGKGKWTKKDKTHKNTKEIKFSANEEL